MPARTTRTNGTHATPTTRTTGDERPDQEAESKVRQDERPDQEAESKVRQDLLLQTLHPSLHPLQPSEPVLVRLAELRPAPINDKVYRGIAKDDPEIIKMAENMRKNGVQNALTITTDRVIMSGHRRRVAAQLAGIEFVPVVIAPIQSDAPNFDELLATHNMQRTKTVQERTREAILLASKGDRHAAHRALLQHRADEMRLSDAPLPATIEGVSKRKRIGPLKMPMLVAVQKILRENRRWWPMSDRQIHYALLNDPPLRNASKPGDFYANNKNCYGDLTDLTTRARLEGKIEMEAIADETRTITRWSVQENTGAFLQKEVDRFLQGYYLNVQRTQPYHIEIVAEKNTVKALVESVAGEFAIPVTTGRGYCSLPPRVAMSNRLKATGKDRMALIMVSDFDPDGEEIFHSFARSLRDDFGIHNLDSYKAGLTLEQVRFYGLPQTLEAKTSSKNYKKFAERYRDAFPGALQIPAYELEALPNDVLQAELRGIIEKLTDRSALQAARAQEADDALTLEAYRDGLKEFFFDFEVKNQ